MACFYDVHLSLLCMWGGGELFYDFCVGGVVFLLSVLFGGVVYFVY